jgi:hypothetical protein
VFETNVLQENAGENAQCCQAINNNFKNTIPPLHKQEKLSSKPATTAKFFRQKK